MHCLGLFPLFLLLADPSVAVVPAKGTELLAIRTLYVDPGPARSVRRDFITRLQAALPEIQITTDSRTADAELVLRARYVPQVGAPTLGDIAINALIISREKAPRQLLQFDTGSHADLKLTFIYLADELARVIRLERGGESVRGVSSEIRPWISPDVDALFARALELSMAGMYEEGSVTWKEYISKVPKNSFAHFNLGLCFIALERWEEAAKSFARSVRLNRHNDSALYNLGYSYYKLSRWNDAREAFRRVLQINPAHEKARAYLEMLTTKSPPIAD